MDIVSISLSFIWLFWSRRAQFEGLGRVLLLTTSARVAQVIKWFSIMNQDRSHEEGVVLVRIKYLGY